LFGAGGPFEDDPLHAGSWCKAFSFLTVMTRYKVWLLCWTHNQNFATHVNKTVLLNMKSN
jgi:hypothetical protein